MRSILCLLLLSLTSSKAQLLNLRKSSVKILSNDQNHQAGLKETKSIESMRSVAEITDQDATSQLLTVDHDIKAITGDKILSNDPTRPNLSEKLMETEPTPSNTNNNIFHLKGHALQDQYHFTDMPEWNDVHGGTHDDYSNIPFAERQALQDLYESADGAHWNYGSSSSAGTHWSFDDPDVNPCADVGWYGVHCIDNRIIGLSLAGINMIGTIPESLSQLTTLVHLDLRGNLLIGRVPTTLCQIKSLVRVDLEGNSITCYPQCLEHVALEVKVHPSTPVCNIIPSRFSLSGPSKETSSSSSALVKISSNNNNISPLERQVLQDLYDSTDGPNWRIFHGDTSWDFFNPDANPCYEEWVGVTCSVDFYVKSLYLSYNNLRGTIPQSIYQLSSLRELYLDGNQLIGSIPSTIGQLISLWTLYLGDNQLIGTIPSTIGQLPSLYKLYLSNNRLTGIVPSSLCQMNYFQTLEFGGNLLQCYPYCLRSTSMNYLDLSRSVGFTPICDPPDNNISPLERLALQDLYFSTGGPYWYDFYIRWDFSNPYVNPCDEKWSAVGCSTDFQVTSLDLSYSSLIGTIPQSIGQLSSLQVLDLAFNRLTGTIPSTIVQLTNLYVLYLSSNRLIGSIPSTFGQLSSLLYLHLSWNLLTGIVPSSLCQLNQLRGADFHGNQLQCYPFCLRYSMEQILSVGVTPICEQGVPTNISPLERQALEDLHSSTDGSNWRNYYSYGSRSPWYPQSDANPCDYQYYDMHWYGITCSPDFHIKYLRLYFNNLRGTIPQSIYQLSFLQELDLELNYLTGTIPSTIGQLSYLKFLYLTRNQLIGSIPSTIGQLSSLRGLYLNDNQLSGIIPSTIGQLSSLQTLNLNDNLLIGTIPSTIELPSLRYLYLSNNILTGIVPPFLCKMGLSEITFDENQLECFPKCLRYIMKLLYVGFNPTCDPPDNNISSLEQQALHDLYDSTDGPNWRRSYYIIRWDFSNPNANPCDEEWVGVGCSAVYHVTSLILNDIYLSGTIPSSIGQLSYLYYLQVARNLLIGTIPSTIDQLTSLQTLDLANNHLTGRIPSAIGKLFSLSYLHLSSNQITGIPSTIGQLSQLTYLELSNNQLTGIPSTIGQLSRLRYLVLSNNKQLIGSIPATIGHLSFLNYLYLYGNQLTGTVPSTIGQLSSLRELFLHKNELIGSIPSTIGQLSSLQYLWLSSNQLTGIVPSSLCKLYLTSLQLQNNRLQCYHKCLISRVQRLNAESTQVCVSEQPTVKPSVQATAEPIAPTVKPTAEPTGPSAQPSQEPTAQPTVELTAPSAEPTTEPSAKPTEKPSAQPTAEPSAEPTAVPSAEPTAVPSEQTTEKPTAQPTGEPTGQQALYDLYFSTDSPNWYYFNGNGIRWDFSNPNVNPCNEGWYGVTCSADYRVTTLLLGGNNLMGTIPSTIGGLSSLTHLELCFNQLTGSIPSTIGQLSSLQQLYLGGNLLIGTIPSTIGQLSSLSLLDLYINQLTGFIPSTLGQLSSLIHLYLDYNQLTGTIPSSIGQLSSLQFIYLSSNQIEGTIPSTIGQLSSLLELLLADNQLIGTIPSTIYHLISLQSLDLSDNRLIGTIPSSIGQLSSSLNSLWLDNNHLTGIIPDSLCQLYLYDLQFQNNQLLCYPVCLISRVQYLGAGSTSVCVEPTAEPSKVPSVGTYPTVQPFEAVVE